MAECTTFSVSLAGQWWKLRGRCLRLRADHRSVEDANRALDKLANQAAHLYRDCASAGIPGFNDGLIPRGDVQGERMGKFWNIACLAMGMAYPSLVSLPPMVGEYVAKSLDPEVIKQGDYLIPVKNHWRDRAEDYAAMCELLAEMCDRNPDVAEELPPPAPRKQPASDVLTNDERERIGRADLVRRCVNRIDADPARFTAAAKMLDDGAYSHDAEETDVEGFPLANRLTAATAYFFHRQARASANDTVPGWTLEERRAIVLLTALLWAEGFDGAHVGLGWPRAEDESKGASSDGREQAYCRLTDRHIREWMKLAGEAFEGPDSEAPALSVADSGPDEFRSGQWFNQNTEVKSDRLRKAAHSSRKSKRVRKRMVDGVECYSVEDAQRWWPEDMASAEHGGKGRTAPE